MLIDLSHDMTDGARIWRRLDLDWTREALVFEPMRRVHFSSSSASLLPLLLVLVLVLLPQVAQAFVPSLRKHAQQQQRPGTCRLGTLGRSAGPCIEMLPSHDMTGANPHMYVYLNHILCTATEADAEQQPSRGPESTDRQGFLKGLGITASAALLGTYDTTAPHASVHLGNPCTYM